MSSIHVNTNLFSDSIIEKSITWLLGPAEASFPHRLTKRKKRERKKKTSRFWTAFPGIRLPPMDHVPEEKCAESCCRNWFEGKESGLGVMPKPRREAN
jgi:hypothetical protein